MRAAVIEPPILKPAPLNKLSISVLFIYEKYFDNPAADLKGYSAVNSKANGLLDQLNNSILGSQNAGFIFNKVALLPAPASLGCVGNINAECRDKLITDIVSIQNNDQVQAWKLQYKADIVVLLRHDYYIAPNNAYTTIGAALPYDKNKTKKENAKNAVISSWLPSRGVIGNTTGFRTQWHELGHILGADHSQFNTTAPGASPTRGFITQKVWQDRQYTKMGCYYTIMTYYATAYDVCNDPNRQDFYEEIYRFSSPIGTYWNTKGQQINLGSTGHNNFATMQSLAAYVSTYDQAINKPPVGIITKSNSTPYQKRKTLTFDANSSTDPDDTFNDLSFNWQLTNSAGNVISFVPNSSTFRYSFDLHGTYTLTLLTLDPDTANHTTSLTFDIAPSAPVMSVTERNVDFQWRWTAPAGTTHYKTYKKVGNGPWQVHNPSSTRNWLSMLKASMDDNVQYSYKVQACNGSCSVDSNTASGVDNGTPPTCNPVVQNCPD